jgi:predicted RNase H-like HicB family nuclease
MKVQIVIEPETDGGYSAFVPGFPGCTSCGDTLEETVANIREAFEGVLEVMQERDAEFNANSADHPDATRKTIEV